MKILILGCCYLLLLPSAKSQIEWDGHFGVGTNAGLKMWNGTWGIFGHYHPNLIQKKTEFVIGVGIRQSTAFDIGARFRIFESTKRLQALVGIHYSWQLAGEFRYDNDDTGYEDTYNTAATRYWHSYLAGRFSFDDHAAIQLSLGYSHNIGGINIEHTIGPDEHFDEVHRSLESGLLAGIDLIIFLAYVTE